MGESAQLTLKDVASTVGVSAMTVSLAMGSTRNNYLGKSPFNDPYLKGLVDEFRIYKGAMSAGQVSALP